jgi:hypothetical protein
MGILYIIDTYFVKGKNGADVQRVSRNRGAVEGEG